MKKNVRILPLTLPLSPGGEGGSGETLTFEIDF